MPTAVHPFSPEEIMAYRDGELQSERRLAAARHLEQCNQCRDLLANLEEVSKKLACWTVEETSPDFPRPLVGVNKSLGRVLRWKRPWLLIPITAAGFLLAIIVFVQSGGRPMSYAVNRQRSIPTPEPGGVMGGIIGGLSLADPPASNTRSGSPSGPLIVRTAQLTVTSKNFDRGRTAVEQIAKAHGGYIAQLAVNTPTGASRSLNATLRIPAAQIDTTLRDLARLGHVEEESLRSEDVTRRYVDVNARLSNLRTTEERLLQILKERTGRLADVLQVEQAVDRTRGEIEMTEAEQKSLSNQIDFASVQLRLSEEYNAPLDGNGSSVINRLHNSTVEGYRNVVDIAIGALALLLSTGPTLLFLGVIAFYPVRILWRKWRERRSRTRLN